MQHVQVVPLCSVLFSLINNAQLLETRGNRTGTRVAALAEAIKMHGINSESLLRRYPP